jgi:hypothetical protein
MGNIMKFEKKYYFIYKTTNLVNGKYYWGRHSTNNLDDGYIGSGNYISRAIKKHGKDKLSCQIMEYLLDMDSLKAREKEIVTLDLIKDPLCMNMSPGGGGGCAYNRIVSDETRKKISIANTGQIYTDERRTAMSRGQTGKINLHSIRKIIIEGVEYESIISASKLLGINDRTISSRLRRDNYPTWQYKDTPKAFIEKKHCKSKCIIVDGILYASMGEAEKGTSRSRAFIRKRCLSNEWPNWNYA